MTNDLRYILKSIETQSKTVIRLAPKSDTIRIVQTGIALGIPVVSLILATDYDPTTSIVLIGIWILLLGLIYVLNKYSLKWNAPQKNMRTILSVVFVGILLGTPVVIIIVETNYNPLIASASIVIWLLLLWWVYAITKGLGKGEITKDNAHILQSQLGQIIWIFKTEQLRERGFFVNFATLDGNIYSIRVNKSALMEIWQRLIRIVPKQASQGWHRDLYIAFKKNREVFAKNKYIIKDSDTGYRGFMLSYTVGKLFRHWSIRFILGIELFFLAILAFSDIFRRLRLFFLYEYILLISWRIGINQPTAMAIFLFFGVIFGYLFFFNRVGKPKALEAFEVKS